MLRYLIIATPLNVTVFWAIVFLSNSFWKNKARFWLGLFMLMVALLYSCHAAFFLGHNDLYIQMDSLYMFCGLSVYPMYYFYVRLLTCDVSPRKSYWLHLVPAVILSALLLLLRVIATDEVAQVYYNSVLIGNRWPDGGPELAKLLALVFFFGRFVFGTQVFVYLFLGYQLVSQYEGRVSNFYSNLEGRKLIWVQVLTISFLITSLLSTVANMLGRGYFLESDLYLSVPSVSFSILFFVIGLLGNKQDQTIQMMEEQGFDLQVVGGSIPESAKKDLKDSLIKLLEEEKLYLNSEIRITELCKRMITNRTYLSRLINEEFGLSFSDFINSYRVRYAGELLAADKDETLSIAQVAEKSGFGSLSSFNRAFRKAMGVGPGSFRKSLRSNHPI
ncbi:helix-turn-helix domain-containing protein [Mangrovibacterium sp.]|uniref:helix-turn-helix domain-containing protein n=1 Tax=Mangrovibacterium sp. TaxID=1961364 RepID=UPI003568AF7F